MAKERSRKGKHQASGDQMDLFEVQKKRRKNLRQGETRRYRSRKGHTYELTRIE